MDGRRQEVTCGERDGPADDADVDDELGKREVAVEGALCPAGEWQDDVVHHYVDIDAVERACGEWMFQQKWETLARENVDGGDGEGDDEVQGEPERCRCASLVRRRAGP
jgi:hypothetical protein